MRTTLMDNLSSQTSHKEPIPYKTLKNFENLFLNHHAGRLTLKDDLPSKVPYKESVPYKTLKDFEDLFLDKRSGHLTEYIYCGNVDYYDKLVKEELKYYLTTAETEILNRHKKDIANFVGENCNVVEIGPGPKHILQQKVIPLLKEFKSLISYTSIDVTIDYATQASDFIRQKLPRIACSSYNVDCTGQLPRRHANNMCVLFLGSTLSNFTDAEITQTFSSFLNFLESGESLIFSMDCNNDVDSIGEAYNNPHVSDLIFNILHHLKSYLPTGDFDPAKFKFHYEWDSLSKTVKLCMISTKAQSFYLNNKIIAIPKNKKYHLAKSRKFNWEFIDYLAMRHNFIVRQSFTDAEKRIRFFVIQKK